MEAQQVKVMRQALEAAIANTHREIEEWDEEQEENNYELTSTDDFEYRANMEGTLSGYEFALSLLSELCGDFSRKV